MAFSLAVAADLADGTKVTLSSGRRTRISSARELFGEALGRFLVNDALRPETAWLADIAFDWQGRHASVMVNPFIQRGIDTIGQRVVHVGGTALR